MLLALCALGVMQWTILQAHAVAELNDEVVRRWPLRHADAVVLALPRTINGYQRKGASVSDMKAWVLCMLGALVMYALEHTLCTGVAVVRSVIFMYSFNAFELTTCGHCPATSELCCPLVPVTGCPSRCRADFRRY